MKLRSGKDKEMKKQELKKDTLPSLNATLKYEIQSLDLANFHSVSAFSELIEINCKYCMFRRANISQRSIANIEVVSSQEQLSNQVFCDLVALKTIPGMSCSSWQ